jgi:hypothetical protein
MKLKRFNDIIINESFKKDKKQSMIEIYNEFGIDIHDIPTNLQSSINNLIKEIIKLRNKK